MSSTYREGSEMNLATIDDLFDYYGDECYFLESTKKYTRYAIPFEESEWVCNECGNIIIDPSEGCDDCENGEEE